MSEPSALPAGGQPAKAIRLVFSFDGDHVTLMSQQPVEMVLPPSDPVEGTQGHKGFWYELRDAQDRPLYRKVMQHPMREDVEVFSDDPDQHSIVRQTVPNRKGVFVALVPDTENGHAVTLSSSPRRLPFALQPATEIARFALKK
jgi:hypothetical protein